ncbi:MAG: 2-oxoglutarate dehydrogenase complex dihydrolipoyllysine-residue succinyltransferase [Methylococcaceae bacterium]|nr:2-oxoglutarate dehydrogenase complex dihydrolipoyllysine-residue succinyltransferase [Methylococcaceae bacterium]
MHIEVLVPNLPESVVDATLVNWHKAPGDQVNKGDNLVDLETDKVVLEVPAPESGILSSILKPDGSLVAGGDVLAIIDPAGTADNLAKATQPKAEGTTAPLSPAVRRILNEHQLNPQVITGTGKEQRITKEDVLHYLDNTPKQPSLAAPMPESPAPVIAAAPNDVVKTVNLRPEQRVPMTRLRAKVAERLLQAQQNAAMLTTFNEVNMQSVIDLRNEYKERFEQKHKIKLGFMSFFVKASVEALKRFPAINASIDGTDIIYHGYYDIGIAVATPRGLIVPVLRDAEQLDFAGIESSIANYGSKARDGSLSYEDLNGGTFTITNGGIFGSMLSTPILNPPQCAILGMHAIKERAVVEKGEIVIRPIMYLALSYDHRLVDGKEAVQFLVTIKECLEAPAHLLLNI